MEQTIKISEESKEVLEMLKDELHMSSLDQAIRFTNSILQQVRGKRMLVITGGNPVVIIPRDE